MSTDDSKEFGDPGHPLSKLIRDRMAEKGWTAIDVSKKAKSRGQEISRATVYALSRNYDRHHAPYARTLKALAAGLEYPYDVVAAAAAQGAGYTLQEIPTTLTSAGTLRVIAAVHADLEPEDQAELARMAEEYAAKLKDAKRLRRNGH